MARPWAPPASRIVDTTEARSGSTNTTPSASATAMRDTLPTLMPGSVPFEIAVSSLVLASPVPGSPRTTVVPGEALASRDA